MGLRERATSRMIDSVVEAAKGWTDRYEEIGFTERQTQLLNNLLRARIDTLR